jgi:hypothetical protein
MLGVKDWGAGDRRQHNGGAAQIPKLGHIALPFVV